MIKNPRWKHPFPALVAGPSASGKTQFVKRLLESGEDMIDGAPENIIWCYGTYQPALTSIQNFNIPPRANPGHLTVHRPGGGGNWNVALKGWGI